jgi:DNA-directed RNA polymerase specialized sigma24 family protein
VDAESEDFARFVDLRQRALLRSAWLLTGEWGLAEDLVQTALARTWLRWGGFTGAKILRFTCAGFW